MHGCEKLGHIQEPILIKITLREMYLVVDKTIMISSADGFLLISKRENN